MAQIDLRNGDHVVGSTFMIVPGASFGVLCQVEFEIILYYLAKSFVFVGILILILIHIVLSPLKRFGMEALVDIVSAVGVLCCTIRALYGLAWAQLGKRSQFPALVFFLLEMSELVEVLFFLSLSNHASLEKLRSSVSSNGLLRSHVHRGQLNWRWLFLIRLVQVSVGNVATLAPRMRRRWRRTAFDIIIAFA